MKRSDPHLIPVGFLGKIRSYSELIRMDIGRHLIGVRVDGKDSADGSAYIQESQ